MALDFGFLESEVGGSPALRFRDIIVDGRMRRRKGSSRDRLKCLVLLD